MTDMASNQSTDTESDFSELEDAWIQTYALWDQHRETGDLQAVDQCIELRREILESCPPDARYLAEFLGELAKALLSRFEATGDLVSLDESIELGRSALQLRPQGHPYRARACMDLAMSLMRRGGATNDEMLLDEAITLNREALQLQPLFPDSTRARENLAAALFLRSEISDQDTQLQDAIDLQREILTVLPIGHPARRLACINLGSSLKSRYADTADGALLDEIITLQREALQSLPPGHPHRELACDHLGFCLRIRSNETGDPLLIDEEVSLRREILQLRPPGHPSRADAFTSLATTLFRQFTHTGDEISLEEAIYLQREGMRMEPPEHSVSTRLTNRENLATVLLMRFSRTEHDKTSLNEAISLHREVLQSRLPGHPLRAQSCLNLATCLRVSFDPTRDEGLLDEVFKLYHEALRLLPAGHYQRCLSLLRAASTLVDPDYEREDTVTAVEMIHEAVSSNTGYWRGILTEASTTLRRVDYSHIPLNSKEILLKTYHALIDIAIMGAGFLLGREAQLQYLAHCHDLGSRAYAVAVGIGEVDHGLQLLERARGVIWTQALHLRDPQLQDLEGTRPELALELNTLLRNLGSYYTVNGLAGDRNRADMFTSFLNDRDIRHMEHARLQQLLHEIWAMSGFSDFMRGSSHNLLKQTANTHPVVVLVSNKEDCFALVITSSEEPLVSIPLPLIQASEIEKLVFGTSFSPLRGPHESMNDNTRIGMKKSERLSTCYRMLATLWGAVVKPIIVHLGLYKNGRCVRPRVQWCTTGVFTFAPVHAAGVYDGPKPECCSDYVVSSYTPTLTALLRAQQNARIVDVRESKLVAIAAEQAQDVTLSPLWNVNEEKTRVIECATAAGMAVDTGNSITASVKLESAQFIHVACHGIQDPEAPLKSRFCVADGDVSVQELMDLNLKNAFLAFLSACETAKGDQKQPDQTIHLAATMLFAGFSSVVATLWAMNDQDGPYIAQRFYDKLLKRSQIEVDDVPYALDYAVTELRRSGAPPERWATFIHMGA